MSSFLFGLLCIIATCGRAAIFYHLCGIECFFCLPWYIADYRCIVVVVVIISVEFPIDYVDVNVTSVIPGN